MTNYHHLPAISVIIPVFNSAAILPILIEQLLHVLPTITSAFEIIPVNDGSRDDSWVVIQRLSAKYPTVQGLNLMRNYGQHNALLAGIRQANYPICITMDDDLQHPPAEIPLLLAKIAEGYDVVYGSPRHLPHSFWRNLASAVTKRAMAYAMGIRNIRDISAFRAIRTELRHACADYKSPHLLLDVLLSWGTTRFTSIQVEHHPRTIGVSNYTFWRLFNQTILIITGFSTGPLRFASIMGFSFQLFGILVFFYVLGRYALEGSMPGFPFLASIIALFSGAQLFALGIIGEYLARIFHRTMERPTYIIKETSGDRS